MTLQGDSEAGATGVGMDGIPVIALNERIGKREEVIVHELLHLKLFAEGYHQIVFVPGTGINKAGFDTLSRLILHPMIFSEIEHSVFYPRMRRMKLDPVFDQRKFWEEALNAAPTQGDQATLRRIYGLYYFKAATQMEDPALLKRSAELYTRNGYGGALELGTLLTSLYAQSMPMTPAKALKLVVDFCNLVFSDTFAFSIIVSGPERRGDYRLPMAYIQMDAKAAPARSL
jgi:hypothetical protein